jgi:hypothetical protein
MLSVAVYADAALGENVKLMLHELWPFKLAPQIVADCVKFEGFVPPMLIDEILTAALVLFVRVTLFAVLVVPKTWLPKLMLVTESVNWAASIPVRLTD